MAAGKFDIQELDRRMRGAIAVTARFTKTPDENALKARLETLLRDKGVARGEIWRAASADQLPLSEEERLRGDDRRIDALLVREPLGIDLAQPPREPRQSTSRGSWRLRRAHHRLQQMIAVLCSPGRGGLFDGWVADCPLLFTSRNAPRKRDVLSTRLYAVQRWYRILSEALLKYLRGLQLIPPARRQPG